MLKISINDLPKVVHTYIKQQVIPKVIDSPWQFMIGLGNNYLASNVATQMLDQFLSKYFNMFKAIGIIDNQNMIDLDLLHKNAITAIDSCQDRQIVMPLYGTKKFTLDKNDLELIYQIANNYAVSVSTPTVAQQIQQSEVTSNVDL